MFYSHKLSFLSQTVASWKILTNVLKECQFKMCTKATNCYLQSVDNPEVKLILSHKEMFALGRNEASNIRDTKVSRKQLLLKANYDNRTVKCVPNGTNLSGCDGFALVENKMYVIKENSRLEVLLGTHKYDLIFEPKLEPKDDSPPSKKLKASPKVDDESPIGTWETIDKSLLVYTSAKFLVDSSLDVPQKVAGFDMDGTLIKTKSGEKFPKDHKDWTLWAPEVKPKLQQLFREGYLLVIFSNQLRLGTEKASRIPYFKQKIEAIVQKFEVPMMVHIATNRDIYRKPAPGMWQHLTKIHPNIDLDKSLFVGDAAGREKNWAPHKKKDHSNADRLFALNIGLKFYTPEEFFFGARKALFQMPQFDPRTVTPYDLTIPLQLNTQEAIMMIGCQGSGKSSFCEQNILQHGYVVINRDTLGSKEKCLKLLEQSLKEGKSVVIDNTHPNKNSRRDYLEMCKKHNVPIKCFVMDVPPKHTKHNNCFRSMIDTNHAQISEILINSYLKNFQKPTLDEGFSNIYEFKFNPKFKNDDHEKLYKMFLLES